MKAHSSTSSPPAPAADSGSDSERSAQSPRRSDKRKSSKRDKDSGRGGDKDKVRAGERDKDKSDKGDKRERILDAAERVFARSGFYQSRVSEIARDAGVADGTIYLYFKSKDELLISLFESRMERVNRHLASALAGLKSASERLTALVETHFRMVKEHPQLAEVLTIELRRSSKFMKEYANPRFGEFLKIVASVIEEGQASGELDTNVPPPLAARMLFGIVDELALAWILRGGESYDVQQTTRWVIAMVMDGLAPRPESSTESTATAPSPSTDAANPD